MIRLEFKTNFIILNLDMNDNQSVSTENDKRAEPSSSTSKHSVPESFVLTNKFLFLIYSKHYS